MSPARWLIVPCLVLTGCQTATDRHLEAALKACDAGDRMACDRALLWERKEAVEAQEQQARAAAIMGIAAGMQAGAAIGRSFAPQPIQSPIYLTPSPLPTYTPPVHCTATHFPGMITTTMDCE